MKLKMLKLLALLAVGYSVNAYAAEPVDNNASSKLLMYIQPVDYTNPIMLWRPYQNYWFYQGPVVEKVAMTAFSAAYGDVGMCEANLTGKTLVWLQPKLFYNPQVQMFYAEVKASAYKGIGEHVATYVGKAQVHGFMGIKTDSWIEKSYKLAIDDAVAKMQADKALQAYVSGPTQVSAPSNTPCGMVTLFPTAKVKAMSF